MNFNFIISKIIMSLYMKGYYPFCNVSQFTIDIAMSVSQNNEITLRKIKNDLPFFLLLFSL